MSESMKAVDFLPQIRFLDIDIENKKADIKKLEEFAIYITAPTNCDVVQTSNISDKVGNTVSRILDLKNELYSEINEYLRKKQLLITALKKLPPREYCIIHKFYIQKVSIQEIADGMGYSVRQIHRIKHSGMKKLKNVIV